MIFFPGQLKGIDTPEKTKEFLEKYREQFVIDVRFSDCAAPDEPIEINLKRVDISESEINFEFATEKDAELFWRYNHTHAIKFTFETEEDKSA